MEGETAIMAAVPEALRAPLMLLTRKHLYLQLFLDRMASFVEELFDTHNSRVLSYLAALVNEADSNQLRDQFIQSISQYAIAKCHTVLNAQGETIVESLLHTLGVFKEAISMFNVREVEFGLKYFREMINASGHRISLQIARHIHQQMLRHDQRLLANGFGMIPLIQELEDDSYFFNCFRQFLGIRLVKSTRTSIQDEIQLVNVMRSVFQLRQNTSLTSMIRDVTEAAPDFSTETPFLCRFLLLSVAFWPNYPSLQIPLPSEVQNVRVRFETFYRETNRTRAIKWLDALESCTFRFQQGTVLCSSIQLAVFEKFVQGGRADDLDISDDQRQLAIRSFIRAGLLDRSGHLVLTFRPSQKVLDISRSTICYPQVSTELTKNELFQRRRCQLDAVITRALKRRGPSSISDLFQETQSEYRFPLRQSEFKECISSLLAQCYIFKDVDSLYRT
jgi:hypothetical protein